MLVNLPVQVQGPDINAEQIHALFSCRTCALPDLRGATLGWGLLSLLPFPRQWGLLVGFLWSSNWSCPQIPHHILSFSFAAQPLFCQLCCVVAGTSVF